MGVLEASEVKDVEQEKAASQRSASCLQCGQPIPQKPMGRPRKWCSAACRQRVLRDRQRYKRFRQRVRNSEEEEDLVQIAREFKRRYPKMSEECAAHIRLGGEVARCAECGTPFIALSPTAKYCSQDCQRKTEREFKRRQRAGLYTAPRAGQALSRYMEMLIDQGRRIPFCPVCGNYLDVAPYHVGRPPRFCGSQCADRYQNVIHPVKRCAACRKPFRQKVEQQRFCSVACQRAARRGE